MYVLLRRCNASCVPWLSLRSTEADKSCFQLRVGQRPVLNFALVEAHPPMVAKQIVLVNLSHAPK